MTERGLKARMKLQDMSEAPIGGEVGVDGKRAGRMTERAQTACCHASVVECQSEAPEQSEDRGVVRGDGEGTARI